MRVLQIGYQQLRRYGRTRVSWTQKLHYGLIKNDHFVHSFSDRDVAAFEAPLRLRDLGRKRANRRLLETAEAVDPDLVIVGHADIITNETLEGIRDRVRGVVIAHCNNDPLFVPENVDRIAHRAAAVDAVFVSTGVRELERFAEIGARLYHMPNSVDASIERFDASRCSGLPIDLIFCSHSENYTERLAIVSHLRDHLSDELKFDIFGCFGQPSIWGLDYDRALARSSMGLNLNRQEGLYWYSSARMAQLGGNGVLTFVHSSGGFEDLFPSETLVYFDSNEHLLAQIRAFHGDDAKRRAWASNTRRFFHAELNSTHCAQYIVEAAMERPYSHEYAWHRR